ncbi:hypothetical protein EV138_0079 [Kribbella voronezhensis]|uniref:Uncharacterized protein n=1 Tax=Kribbella voronezhensis TaxID=2512212 RepID=A0A4R7T4Y9_9ACTN|nr:hypothetical protein EV138_0079 [Kribbella voronezhensis]
MDKLFTSVVRNGVRESEFHGCTDEEIDEIRLRQGVPSFPYDYICYLRRIGRSAGRFQIGTDAYYPDVLDLKEATIELLKENKSKASLGVNSLVFQMHQGYEFAGFPDLCDRTHLVREVFHVCQESESIGRPAGFIRDSVGN